MKWLAALALVVAALLVLLFLQLHEDVKPDAVASKEPVTVQPVKQVAAADSRTGLAAAAAQVQEATNKAEKVDINSDAFFIRFDELVPQLTTRNAAKCYTGGLGRVHRNQKVKLSFKDTIKNGVVTITDVKVVESTIGDLALIDCFVREVAATTWTDEGLPDWSQDDELVIRPERGMKKFTKENMEYEGSGPDFTNVHPNAR
jgi:hypothetical protein